MKQHELKRMINSTYKAARKVESQVNGKRMNLTDATIELGGLLGKTLYIMNEMLIKIGDDE